MKIVMIAGHACIRVQKMAIPLIERGHEVHLIAMKVPSFWQQYKTFTLCSDVEQMVEAIRLHAAAVPDVFHCHNEPSWFVTAVKEITGSIPVILDVHDSYLARSTPEEAGESMDSGETHIRITTEERNNFQLADGLVFVGDAFRDLIVDEFNLEQPALTLPSCVPRRFFQYETRDWHGGLVYQGKVNLPSETKGAHTGFEYCDYTDLVGRCAGIGMDLHLYAIRTDEPFRKHYGDALIHKSLAYDDLLPAISRHDWGLVGNSVPSREWDVAMPNKLFEYMAAGVPVVVMNAKSSAGFVREHGIGIEVSGPEELATRWGEHRKCRARLLECRQKWSMNSQICALEDFYRRVVMQSATSDLEAPWDEIHSRWLNATLAQPRESA